MLPLRAAARCRHVLSTLERHPHPHPHRHSQPRSLSHSNSSHLSSLSHTSISLRHNTTATATKPAVPVITRPLRRGHDVIPEGYLESIQTRHLPPHVYARDITPEMLDLAKGGCRTMILTRDAKRNALNLNMIRFMNQHLKAYSLSEDVMGVIIRSNSDKFFCDGGDIKSLYDAGKKRKAGQIDADDLTRTFFREEYRLNYRISRMQKAYIAILNGSTMGGGAGISIHGRYRVATKNTVFAMPETAIGFFPDVGASYFLSRLENHVGTFLGLTGHRLTGPDVVHAGLATHWGIPGQDTEVEMMLAGEEVYHRDFPDKAVNWSFPEWNQVIEPPYVNLHSDDLNSPFDEVLRAAYVLAVIRGIPVPPVIHQQTVMQQGEPKPTHILVPLMDELVGYHELVKLQEEEKQAKDEGRTYEKPYRTKSDHARMLVNAFLTDPVNKYHPAKLWYDQQPVHVPFSLQNHLKTISDCFSKSSVEDIIQALRLSKDAAFAQKTIETLSKMSPTSLKVTLKMLQAGRYMDLDACLKMEYRIAQRMMMGEDFYAGVDAAIISKHRNPVWSPATLDKVTPDMVNAYFAPFSNSTDPTAPNYEPELDLSDLNDPARVD